jgi:RNA polymerase-associated protein RTF1
VALPTKASLSDKIDEINGLINHKWTSEEIKARLARKNELRKRFDPAERERVSRLLEEARERGDDDKVEELQEQLDKMGSQRLAFRTSLGPAKNQEASSRRDTEQDRLAERNRENRRLNAEAVRRAQLKERQRTREIEQALQRGEHVDDDPSRRVKTKAKFVHDVHELIEKKSATASGTSTPTANGTPKSNSVTKSMPAHLAKLQLEKHAEQKGVPTIHKPLMDDDVIGALDLDIDVEI